MIETTIEKLGQPSSIPIYSVALKEFPKHNVISYRRKISTLDQEGILWEGLAQETASLHIQYSSPNLNIAIFHDEGFVEENLDVEIQKSVVGKYHDIKTVTFKIVEAFTAASLTFKGHYIKLPEANETIAHWIADNHYMINGPRFNIYHVSPETQSSFENMITEVCFPVKPQ